MLPVNESRRRLTKAGLAVPAVLGTLASKPVLAAVPWKCTVSGQVSGNVSGHAMETCTSLGNGHAALTAATAGSTDTLNSAFGLTPPYFFWNEPSMSLTTDNSDPEATIHQILANSPPTGLQDAQKALVLLLNANGITDPTLYPLMENQAKSLYVAAATGTAFSDSNPPVFWTNAEVKDYIDLLYH
jgi:hypothetical protein